jgi:hypothetical protein
MAIAINVSVNGQAVAGVATSASTYSAAPKKGHAQVAGTLDGKPFTFILTKGKGRGTTTAYCAYFVIGAQVYYFYTGTAFLPSGAVVVTGTQAPVVDVTPAVKAPKRQRRAKVEA